MIYAPVSWVREFIWVSLGVLTAFFLVENGLSNHHPSGALTGMY